MTLFLGYILLSFGAGIFRKYDVYYVVNETVKWLFYPISFFFIYHLLNHMAIRKNQLEKFLCHLPKWILAFAIINAIEHIIIFIFYTEGSRVITRQTIILCMGVSISISYLTFYNLDRYKKVIHYLLITIFTIGIAVSMQRALWIAYLMSVLIAVTFIFRYKKIKVLSFSVILFFALLLILSYSVGNYFIKSNDKIVERVNSFEDGAEASSMIVRYTAYATVWKRIQGFMIFGRGLGDKVKIPIFYTSKTSFIDNSYLQTVWKMGFVGLLFLIILLFSFYKKIIEILKKSSNEMNKFYAFFIGVFFIAILVNGLSCVVLTQYHFNFVWSSLIAVVYFFSVQIDKELIINET